MSAKIVTVAQITIAASGTEQRLLSSPVDKILRAYVSVPASNTGNIYIGDASVSTTRGIEVLKGTTLLLEAKDQFLDLYNFWADAATSGDKVNVTYLEKVGQ